MKLFKQLSGWLGSLSVGRKLTLIYLLDLTAVIYISGILIHEKYLAIDFARKEIVGVAYTTTVRDALMTSLLPADQVKRPRDETMAQLRLLQTSSDADLGAAEDSAAFMLALSSTTMVLPTHPDALKPLIQSARALLTSVGNQSNLILDPDLDSYYSMSLTPYVRLVVASKKYSFRSPRQQ